MATKNTTQKRYAIASIRETIKTDGIFTGHIATREDAIALATDPALIVTDAGTDGVTIKPRRATAARSGLTREERETIYRDTFGEAWQAVSKAHKAGTPLLDAVPDALKSALRLQGSTVGNMPLIYKAVTGKELNHKTDAELYQMGKDGKRLDTLDADECNAWLERNKPTDEQKNAAALMFAWRLPSLTRALDTATGAIVKNTGK